MSDKKQDVNAVTTESNVEDQDYIYTPVPQNKRYGWIKMLPCQSVILYWWWS